MRLGYLTKDSLVTAHSRPLSLPGLLAYLKSLAHFIRSLRGRSVSEMLPVRFTDVQREQLKSIARAVNMCRSLVAEIWDKSAKHLDRFPENARSRIKEIQEALPATNTTMCGRRVSAETLEKALRWKKGEQSSEALSMELKTWQDALLDQVDALLRLQRYVTIAISKLPVDAELTWSNDLSREELTRAQQLNMEIVACELLLGREDVSSLPPNVQVEPTDRCNARCRSCAHRSAAGWRYNDMETSTLDNLHHVLSVAQFVEIFGLGEPTISPSFAHIARLCSMGASETHIITNGTMLMERPELKHFKKIGISFDGATKETFETIRVGIDFDKLVASIRAFREANPSTFIYLTATINRANVDEIPAIADWARRLGLQAVCYHRMYMSEPDLVSAALTREDVPVYKERIDNAKRQLEGSDVKLLDYLLVDQLQPSSEPLNPQASLVTIRSFQPKEERVAGSLAEVIARLKTQEIPLRLRSEILCITDEVGEQALPSPVPASVQPAQSEATRWSLAALEARAALLREEVVARAPEGLKIPYCLAPWYRLCVKADGRLLPCSRWGYTYGNLRKLVSFNDAWNGTFQRQLRRGFHGRDKLHDTCIKCTCIDRYQGMTELLAYVRSLGIAYEVLPKQEGFNPPEGKLHG